MTVCTMQASGASGKRRHRDFDELAQVLPAPVLEDGHAEPVRGRVGYRQTDHTGPGIVLGDAARQNGYATPRRDEFELLLDSRRARKNAPAQFPRLNSFSGSGIIDLAHDGQVADAAVPDTAFALSEDLQLGFGAGDQIVETCLCVGDLDPFCWLAGQLQLVCAGIVRLILVPVTGRGRAGDRRA
jgi:hypothetical protein